MQKPSKRVCIQAQSEDIPKVKKQIKQRREQQELLEDIPAGQIDLQTHNKEDGVATIGQIQQSGNLPDVDRQTLLKCLQQIQGKTPFTIEELNELDKPIYAIALASILDASMRILGGQSWRKGGQTGCFTVRFLSGYKYAISIKAPPQGKYMPVIMRAMATALKHNKNGFAQNVKLAVPKSVRKQLNLTTAKQLNDYMRGLASQFKCVLLSSLKRQDLWQKRSDTLTKQWQSAGPHFFQAIKLDEKSASGLQDTTTDTADMLAAPILNSLDDTFWYTTHGNKVVFLKIQASKLQQEFKTVVQRLHSILPDTKANNMQYTAIHNTILQNSTITPAVINLDAFFAHKQLSVISHYIKEE